MPAAIPHAPGVPTCGSIQRAKQSKVVGCNFVSTSKPLSESKGPGSALRLSYHTSLTGTSWIGASEPQRVSLPPPDEGGATVVRRTETQAFRDQGVRLETALLGAIEISKLLNFALRSALDFSCVNPDPDTTIQMAT